MDFEWIASMVIDEDGDRFKRHYLVDPSGQIRACIDEPTSGRLSYVADIFFSEIRSSCWLYLSLAKSHCEQVYMGMLQSGPKKKRTKKV